MTTKAKRVPLQTGHVYVDRRERRWEIVRISNAGTTGWARLPSMALARCLDSCGPDSVVRNPQWFDATTWRWCMAPEALDSPIDLVRCA